MLYCIVLAPDWIIGPFYSLAAARAYVDSDPELNQSMIQPLMEPEY